MHVANVIYPFVDKDFEVIKTFDENAEEKLSKFSLGCKGNNTPTGSALNAALELLLESQFDRKIVFLITDGYPTEWLTPLMMFFQLLKVTALKSLVLVLKLCVDGF